MKSVKGGNRQGTILINFNDRIETKKGTVGEKIVHNVLEQCGFVVYFPSANKAHPFDVLVASSDKTKLAITEVKAKEARKYYPDTGINLNVFEGYQKIIGRYRVPFWLFFVDRDSKTIYGGELKRISSRRVVTHKGKEIEYPKIEERYGSKPTIYFPIESMKFVGIVPDHEVQRLIALSSVNKSYKAPTQPYGLLAKGTPSVGVA